MKEALFWDPVRYKPLGLFDMCKKDSNEGRAEMQLQAFLEDLGCLQPDPTRNQKLGRYGDWSAGERQDEVKLPGRSFSLVDQIFCSIAFFSGSKGIVQGAAHPSSPAHYLRRVCTEVLPIVIRWELQDQSASGII